MLVVLVVLAVVTVAAVAVALRTRSQLAAQRRLLAAAEQRAVTAEGEREAATSMLDDARQERDDAAAARAAEADAREVGVDASALWALELLRSERTWRHHVAPGPDTPSVLADAAEPLREALQIELDAAREEVGVEVELAAELPADLTIAGSLLALRVAQELLAPAVRRGELTSVQLGAGRPRSDRRRALARPGRRASRPRAAGDPGVGGHRGRRPRRRVRRAIRAG